MISSKHENETSNSTYIEALPFSFFISLYILLLFCTIFFFSVRGHWWVERKRERKGGKEGGLHTLLLFCISFLSYALFFFFWFYRIKICISISWDIFVSYSLFIKLRFSLLNDMKRRRWSNNERLTEDVFILFFTCVRKSFNKFYCVWLSVVCDCVSGSRAIYFFFFYFFFGSCFSPISGENLYMKKNP